MGDRAMSDMVSLEQPADDGALSFARGFVKSDAFMTLFREGMGLVEQTATYLDGEGRAQSAALSREVSLAYATESMRLTTRLMQIASWLLVQRAVAEGELTSEQARLEKNKVRIAETVLAPDDAEFALLPEGLRALIARSRRLQERIGRLESQMSGAMPVEAAQNPVQSQIASLQSRLGLPF